MEPNDANFTKEEHKDTMYNELNQRNYSGISKKYRFPINQHQYIQ